MNQTFTEWLGEDLLGIFIGTLLAIVPVWFLYWVINHIRRWWLVFSLASVPFLIALFIIVPLYVSPLFNDFTSLEDKGLERKIMSLAEYSGVEGSNIYQMNASKQSTKVSAYAAGLFGTKHIVLYDTLIDEFSDSEVLFVMAHEIGHYVMDHLWQSIGIIVMFLFFALWLTNRLIHPMINRFKTRFGFDSLGDMASLPLILLFATVIGFVGQPVTNGFSRVIEEQADRYAMDASGVSGETAATAFAKLAVLNLSDPEPHGLIEFWFYDHPAISKRINFVRTYEPDS
jgi:Zn-dependent protease with chaperone function